ncbi:DUF2550 domain-containing protein [Actinokineospora guangxiensis]|uniref:DUF2550 domain-containing protein n=1 Tax=Actinokineospora guangxiensis TaxID=1490288 RepID=A0ABW0EG11_9PSEU
MDISDVVVIALAAVLLVLLLLVLRRVRLLRRGGVHVSIRDRVDDSGKGWHLGVGRYRGDEFAWFRAFSLRTGPNMVIHRDTLEIATRRDPKRAEIPLVPQGARVLLVTAGDTEYEIAMGPDALTGFLSWLESAPPGRRLPWAS